MIFYFILMETENITFKTQIMFLSEIRIGIFDFQKILSKLSEEYLKKLDIECSEPPGLRGQMLSTLKWKQLKEHSNCSNPDKYPDCPEDRPSPIPTTLTTTSTTSTIKMEPLIEPLLQHTTERPSVFEETESMNRGQDALFNILIIFIGAVVALFCIILAIVVKCYHRSHKGKNLKNPSQPDENFGGPKASSRTDEMNQVKINGDSSNCSRNQRTSSSDGSNVITMEVEDKSIPIDKPHEGSGNQLRGDAPSTVGSNSDHGYEFMDFQVSESSWQQHPANSYNQPPSCHSPPGIPFTQPTAIHLTIQAAQVPAIEHATSPAPVDQQSYQKQQQLFNPNIKMNHSSVKMMPGYLNTTNLPL